MRKKLIKVGGYVLDSNKLLEKAICIVKNTIPEYDQILIVASAGRKTTDTLIRIFSLAAQSDENYKTQLKQLLSQWQGIVRQRRKFDDVIFKNLSSILKAAFLTKDSSNQLLDSALACGEDFTAALIHDELNREGIKNTLIDSSSLIITDDNFGQSRILAQKTKEKIMQTIGDNKGVFLIPGFSGSTIDGKRTTLGRSGSDLSATTIGAAQLVEEIEIWSRVSGVMTSDPSLVEGSMPISKLSWDEAMELSHFGASVIHPPSIQPAKSANIPIIVRNIFDEDFQGTRISDQASSTSNYLVGLSSIAGISLLRIEGSGLFEARGTAKRTFKALSDRGINAVMIVQTASEHSICIAIDGKHGKRGLEALNEQFSAEISNSQIDSITLETNLAIIGAVGEAMRRKPGVAAHFFGALSKNGINVVSIAQGSSERNLCIVIDGKEEKKALNVLHDSFFLSGNTRINLFQVGVGQVGATLLSQIQENLHRISVDRKLEINIIGIANSQKALFSLSGIDLSNWESELQDNGIDSNIEKFISRMSELNLSNSIFVDCTASEDVANKYVNVLKNNISIVTPNKKASSGSLERYRELKKLTKHTDVKFCYETNVGAGLPVINTLSDLISSGDEILCIEGVLSGTLSYIFNIFNGSRPFSKVVQEAKNSGYTEPDPRDDLSGADVARKLLILAREMGLPLEEDDIEVESLVPSELSLNISVEEFLLKLQDHDDHYAHLISQARKEDKALRYIGKITNDGKAKVSLTAVPSSHPCYPLTGTDNLISFTTERYKHCPLVIKGPGAGTEVTAAGAFADILRMAAYLV